MVGGDVWSPGLKNLRLIQTASNTRPRLSSKSLAPEHKSSPAAAAQGRGGLWFSEIGAEMPSAAPWQPSLFVHLTNNDVLSAFAFPPEIASGNLGLTAALRSVHASMD